MNSSVVVDLCRLIVEIRAILEALRAIFDELDDGCDDPKDESEPSISDDDTVELPF